LALQCRRRCMLLAVGALVPPLRVYGVCEVSLRFRLRNGCALAACRLPRQDRYDTLL
jgi:hypothetical protein